MVLLVSISGQRPWSSNTKESPPTGRCYFGLRLSRGDKNLCYLPSTVRVPQLGADERNASALAVCPACLVGTGQ